jgi:hypothetical protein
VEWEGAVSGPFQPVARTIVQITAHGEGEQTYPCLYALCNDGTVWMIPNTPRESVNGDRWVKLAPIPQDTEVQP